MKRLEAVEKVHVTFALRPPATPSESGSSELLERFDWFCSHRPNGAELTIQFAFLGGRIKLLER